MAPQFLNEATTSTTNIKLPVLKGTPKLRAAFDQLVWQESFLESSECILRFVSSCLPTSPNKEALPEDVKYVFKRLISGLASQREFARHGCYTTLQALLQLHTEGLPFAVFYMDEYYTKNDEEVTNINHILGHVLACGAIIRCGYVMEDKGWVRNIVKKLLVFRQAKSYMEPIVAQFLTNLVVMYKDKDINNIIWEEVNEKIQEKLDLPPSLLWLRFIFSRDEYLESLSDVQPDFQSNTYSTAAFKIIGSTLKGLFDSDVNVTPMIEDYFKSLVLLERSEDCQGPDNVALFFSEAIYPFLLKKEIKESDVIFTFNVAQMAVPYLTKKDHVGKVLGTKLMEQVISKSKSMAVTASGRGLMSAVLQLIIKYEKEEENSTEELQFFIVKRLTSTSASLRFDYVTGSTLLEQASTHFNEATIKSFAKMLSKILAEKDVGNVKSYYVNEVMPVMQWLSRLICHPNMRKREDIKWKAKMISLLLVFTFFKKHSKENQLRLKDFYLRGLNLSVKNMESQVLLIEAIIDKVNVSLGKFSSTCSLDQESRSCFERVSGVLQDLRERDEADSKKDLVVFRLLYGHMILNLFIHPESSFEFIKEIDECCSKVLAKASKKEKKSKKKEGSKGVPEWVEVVLDMLLGILSKEESFWKKIACTIFRYICHSLSPASLVLLTDVLNSEKNSEILYNADEEDGDMGEEGDECEDEDDEDEDDDDDDDDDEGDEEDEEESDDEEEEEENETDLMKMKMEMQKVAGDVGETVDLDNAPEEELDRMNQQFGAIFRQFRAIKNKRTKEQKQHNKDDNALMNFRIRVCDLMIVLVKETPSFAHLLPLIPTLLNAIKEGVKNKNQVQLVAKCRSVLSELSQVKDINVEDFTAQDLVKELDALFQLCKDYPEEMKEEVSRCYLFLFRCASHLSKEEGKQDSEELLFSAYTDQLEMMLMQWEWYVEGPLQIQSKSLSLVLNKLCGIVFLASTKSYKKRKGLELIKLIFRNKSLTTVTPKALANLVKNIVSMLDSVQQMGDIHPDFLLSILDLLKILKRQHNRNLDITLNWTSIEDCISSFLSRISLKNHKLIRRAFIGVTSILKIPFNWHDESSEQKSKKRELVETEESWVFNDMIILKKKRTEDVDNEIESVEQLPQEEETEPVKRTKKEKKNKRKEKEEIGSVKKVKEVESQTPSKEDTSEKSSKKKHKKHKDKPVEEEEEESTITEQESLKIKNKKAKKDKKDKKDREKRRKIQENRVEFNKKRFNKLAVPELEGFRFSDYIFEESATHEPEETQRGDKDYHNLEEMEEGEEMEYKAGN